MYDVVVVGGGPGGYAAAIRVAQLGGNVALIEADKLGGTCVNRGCIPSKIWMRAARMVQLIGKSEMFGVKTSVEGLDLKKIVERKNGVASEIQAGMNALLANNGVDFISGRAQLKSAGEIDVGGKPLQTGKIILATGSSLMDAGSVPGLAEAALTTDELFDLEQIPRSILIYGDGGPIEIEMASLLQTFGCEVTLTTNKPRLLPREDSEVSQRITRSLRDQGVKIATRLKLTEIKKSAASASSAGKEFKKEIAESYRNQGIVISSRMDFTYVQSSKTGFTPVFDGKDSPVENVDNVLLSARRPNTDGLGLENVGVKLNEEGFIEVDDTLQTSEKGIYAIGDVTGGWMVSHAASAMAVNAAENAMGQNRAFDSKMVPRGLWTTPQVGSIGLSEEDAEEQGFDVETGNFPCSVNGLAAAYGEVDGAAKVVWDADTRDILGIHIVAPSATEMMGEAALALQLECSIDELAYTVHIHPTLSETVMDGNRDAAGWALYLPKSG